MATDNFTLDISDINNFKLAQDSITTALGTTPIKIRKQDCQTIPYKGVAALGIYADVLSLSLTSAKGHTSFTIPTNAINPVVTVTLGSSSKVDLTPYGLVHSVSIEAGKAITVYVDAIGPNANKITSKKALPIDIHLVAFYNY